MKLIVSVVGLYPPPADCYVQPKKNMFALLLVSIIDFTVNNIQLIVSIVDPCPPPADCYVAQPPPPLHPRPLAAASAVPSHPIPRCPRRIPTRLGTPIACQHQDDVNININRNDNRNINRNVSMKVKKAYPRSADDPRGPFPRRSHGMHLVWPVTGDALVAG